MIPGYNHNVSYKGKVYHVQTEDSGVQNPHIITHLFVGGNIIESRKTSYADIVTSANLSEMLVELMQDQHKTMLKELIRGSFDHKLEERSVNAASLNGPAPLNVEAGQHRASMLVPGGGGDMSAGGNKPAAPQQAAKPAAPAPAKRPAAQAPPPAAAAPQKPPAGTIFSAPPPAAAARTETVDRDAPMSIFGEAPPDTSTAKVIEAATLEAAFESPNEKAVDSIFGEDLISEKSLDEVILSYLAEDLQQD